MPNIFKASDIVINDNKHLISSGTKASSSKETLKAQKKDNMDLRIYNILERARKEATKIIDHAYIESEVILNEARKDAENSADGIRNTAKDEGFEQGYNEGILAAERIKQEAVQIKEELLESRKNIYRDLEPEILDLIISITDKLLNKALEIKPDIVLNLIRQGLNETTLSGDIFIRVSPEKYDLVLKNKDKIVYAVDSSCDFEIIRDSALHGSDCVIETAFGNIDCSLDEQFKLLKENLLLIGDTIVGD